MERYIEVADGGYPDGFPKSKWKHESCTENDGFISGVYPYCPYCGKKITNVRVLRDGFEKWKNEHFEKHGFICE